MKLTIIMVFGFFSMTTAFAGESGFIYHGQEYVVYKDGKKVGKTAEELGLDAANGKASGRKTASVVTDQWTDLFFQEDNFARCYYTGTASLNRNVGNAFCIKK